VYLATDNADSIETLVALCPTLKFYFRTEVNRDFLVVTPDDIQKNEIFLEQRLFRSDLPTRQACGCLIYINVCVCVCVCVLVVTPDDIPKNEIFFRAAAVPL